MKIDYIACVKSQAKMSLAKSSIPHEYYLGDLPGTLQYNKSPSEILNISNITPDDTLGFVLDEHTIENKNACYHIQKIQKIGDWC